MNPIWDGDNTLRVVACGAIFVDEKNCGSTMTTGSIGVRLVQRMDAPIGQIYCAPKIVLLIVLQNSLF